MRKRAKYQTLHCHTTASDGLLDYRQVLDKCLEHNIGLAAFTDHDCVPGGKSLSALAELKGHPTKFILGIEISVGRLREVAGEIPLFHLVGLFINPAERALRAYCGARKEARIRRARKIIANLGRLGFVLTEAEVFDRVGGDSVGRPHIVEALLAREENWRVLEKIKRQVKEESRRRPELLKRYQAVLKTPPRQQIYPLLLTEGACWEGVWVPYENLLDMDEAVALIRKSGGVAILAHWTFSKEKLAGDILEKILREKRLDGLEVVYGLGVAERADEIKEDTVFLRRLVKKYDLVESGGMDVHNQDDFKIFAGSPAARRTIGMAERIVGKMRPSLRWSSLERS